MPRRLDYVRPGNTRKNLGVFLSHRLQAVRIETQSLQDGRCDLHGLHRAGDCLWREVRVRQEHHHVGVVMSEATVFRQLLCAARIRNADVRGHG
jgi:hypothetical protein